MNHRTQNHSGTLKASSNLYQVPNTVVQIPIHLTTHANLADNRVELQMADTMVRLPASEKLHHILEADLADRRVEIQRDDRLKFTLQEWDNTLQKALVTIQYKKTGCINMKSELYQLIGFYTVFQGVIFTSVAQGGLLKCETCWGPTSLSLLVSIATIPAVHDRLKEYNFFKNNLFWEIEYSNTIAKKIQMLKQKGAAFDFAECGEESQHEEKKRTMFRLQARKNQIVKWLTSLFLCVFSSIILTCCYIIPCWESIETL
ncbi:hypothetical protein M758_6G122000 [Ceratodon purpureus]|nr:hypothetical protein M758_6G122000 [Ceratodon purpureus]